MAYLFKYAIPSYERTQCVGEVPISELINSKISSGK